MNIRQPRRFLIAGAALVAAALVALPAAARTWHGFWDNQNETGALVASVDPDGPAAGAGLQRGDLIVGVDGTGIAGKRDLFAAISDHGVDDALRFEVRRGNDLVALTATVGQINGNPYRGRRQLRRAARPPRPRRPPVPRPSGRALLRPPRQGSGHDAAIAGGGAGGATRRRRVAGLRVRARGAR